MAKIYEDPVAKVTEKKFDLVAAGMSELDALQTVFSSKPGLAAQYQRAVRSDPGAIDRALKAEAQPRIVLKMEQGMDRAKAASEVFHECPSLQAALCRPTAAPKSSAPSGPPASFLEVERRVQALKAQGVQHARAVSDVFCNDPDLHRRYLADHNAQARAHRR